VELPARSILVDEATQPPPRTKVPDAAALLAVAERAAAAPSGGGRPASHVDLDRSLAGYAAITTVQYDAHGRPAAVYGLLVNAPALGATLFAAGASHPILPLGRNALLVSAPDGSPLFGGVPGRGGVRATIHPAGALDAMAVTVVAADSLVP